VIESGENPKRCFLYTVGLQSADFPEILVLDVPIFLAEPVFRTLCLLGDKFVSGDEPEVGNTVLSQGLLFQVMQTSAKQRRRHMALHCRLCDPGLKALLLLKPLVGITHDETSWGSYAQWKELRGSLSPDIQHEDDERRQQQDDEDEVEFYSELHNGSDGGHGSGGYRSGEAQYEGGDY